MAHHFRVSSDREAHLKRTEDSLPNLVNVHQCSSCGHYTFPEHFSARDNVRGLYECPVCHLSEALNVQIVDRTEVEGQIMRPFEPSKADLVEPVSGCQAFA